MAQGLGLGYIGMGGQGWKEREEMRNRVEAARREARGGGGIEEKSGEIFDIRGGGEKRLKKRVGGWSNL